MLSTWHIKLQVKHKNACANTADDDPSSINRHQKEHELFILHLYEHANSLLEEHLLNAIQRETEMIEDTTLH